MMQTTSWGGGGKGRTRAPVADVPDSGFALEFRGERGLFASVILMAVTDYAVVKSLLDYGVRLERVGIEGGASFEWQHLCNWLFRDDFSQVDMVHEKYPASGPRLATDMRYQVHKQGATSLEHACDACDMQVESVRDLADRLAAFNLERLRRGDARANRQWRKAGHMDLLRDYTNRDVAK